VAPPGILIALVPHAVASSLAFTSIAVGNLHTCAIAKGGAAHCWGSNGSGSLGDGTNIDHAAPVAVTGGFTFVGLGLGYSHACGIVKDGRTFCWGSNGFDQLGNGDPFSSSRSAPTPVSVP
jgi:alpha-tubulin suppressor-like RCC1 family protein